MSSPEVHNLVFLVSCEQKSYSYKEAAIVARDMFLDRINDLESAAADLLAIASPDYEDVVGRYIRTCQNWISGTESWHMESSVLHW